MAEQDYLKSDETDLPDALEKLGLLLKSYEETEAEIELMEAELKEKKKVFNELSQVHIPQLLLSHGLSRVKLANGREVKIGEDVSVKITDDAAFNNFLSARKEDDIVKLDVTFAKMAPEKTKALFDFLEANEYECDAERGVHPQTLKKYFRTLLGVGEEPAVVELNRQRGVFLTPQAVEKFATVYTYHTTKLSKPTRSVE